MTDKVQILVELIARLRLARLSDDSIAARLGLSRSGLSRILALPEYKHAQEVALREMTGAMDDMLHTRADAMSQEFARDAVPEALRALVDTVRQRRDLKTCLAAAKEILNRDPNDTLPERRSADSARGFALDGRAERLPDKVFEQVALDAATLASGG